MRGRGTKLINTGGVRWGLVRLESGLREIFFNYSSLSDPSDFPRLAVADLVDFEEELERANGMRATRLRIISPA